MKRAQVSAVKSRVSQIVKQAPTLAIDPGLVCLGLAVIDANQCVLYNRVVNVLAEVRSGSSPLQYKNVTHHGAQVLAAHVMKTLVHPLIVRLGVRHVVVERQPPRMGSGNSAVSAFSAALYDRVYHQCLVVEPSVLWTLRYVAASTKYRAGMQAVAALVEREHLPAEDNRLAVLAKARALLEKAKVTYSNRKKAAVLLAQAYWALAVAAPARTAISSGRADAATDFECDVVTARLLLPEVGGGGRCRKRRKTAPGSAPAAHGDTVGASSSSSSSSSSHAFPQHPILVAKADDMADALLLALGAAQA